MKLAVFEYRVMQQQIFRALFTVPQNYRESSKCNLPSGGHYFFPLTQGNFETQRSFPSVWRKKEMKSVCKKTRKNSFDSGEKKQTFITHEHKHKGLFILFFFSFASIVGWASQGKQWKSAVVTIYDILPKTPKILLTSTKSNISCARCKRRVWSLEKKPKPTTLLADLHLHSHTILSRTQPKANCFHAERPRQATQQWWWWTRNSFACKLIWIDVVVNWKLHHTWSLTFIFSVIYF